MTDTRRISLERITRATTVIDPVFLDSPQFLAEPLSERLGCCIVVKVETLNPIRSFKGRGAEYLVSSLADKPALVCSTAGNFGQGMAFAARKRGLAITIFVAAGANPMKVERMRALGADVRFAKDKDADEAAEAWKFAAETGALLVEDGKDAPIAEGAGTIGLELLRWPERLDAVLVPLGDGSLLAGVSCAMKASHHATQTIGVCAERSPAMERSWRLGRVQEDKADTIAEGLAVTRPHAEAVADLTGLADDIVLVEDSTILEAMRLAHQELGLVLETSGAAGLAALLRYQERFRGQLVGVILTGGNLTTENIRKWLQP
jgi:threonine dehydratase